MKAFQLTVLHLTVGVLAFFAVRNIPAQARNDSASPPSKNPPQVVESQRRSQARTAADTRRMTPEGYQAAWDAIPKRRLGKSERIRLQNKLLKEWAQTDLEGALRAAFSESWRGERFQYADAFADVFIDRSEDVLKLIQERKVGILESAVLTEVWSQRLMKEDPKLYLTYLRSLDDATFGIALKSSSSAAKDPAFLTKLLEVAEGRESVSFHGMDQRLRQAAASVLGREELLARIARSSGGMADFYTAALAEELHASSPQADVGEVAERIAAVPEDKRGMFAHSLLMFSQGKAATIQAALDQLVAGQEWSYLDPQTSGWAVRSLANGTDPVVLANWAQSLPPRRETAELFHRGVEPYIRKDPDAAWQWIDGLDNSFWRDRALAEYSQVNLHVFNDPEKSTAAIEQISDAVYREMVKGWRADWERQHAK